MVAPHFRAFRLAGNGVRSCRSQSGRGGRFFRGKQEKGRKEYGDGKGNSQKAEQDEAPLFFRACHIAHSVPSLGNLQANRLNLPVSGKHQPRRNRHLITFGVARPVDHGCPGWPHQRMSRSQVVLAVVVPASTSSEPGSTRTRTAFSGGTRSRKASMEESAVSLMSLMMGRAAFGP